jgi:hypothetical protein
MLMRVSVGIHLDDLESVLETYDLMSKKFFTHATPTLFNAGTPKPQMSSCFLLAMQDDSIDGIYDTLKQTAKSISRWSRTFYTQCSCNRFLHSWNKWNIKWYCSYVESIQ